MTYCTQQSVVDAQRGLHEKKTLAGVSNRYFIAYYKLNNFYSNCLRSLISMVVHKFVAHF